MRILSLLKWDFIFQIKYGITLVGIIITGVWLFIISLLPTYTLDYMLPIVFITDLAITGFMFMAAMIFFDQNEGTLYPMMTSPIKVYEYLFSKWISLNLFLTTIGTVLVLFISLIKNVTIHYSFAILASFLSSSFFILLGLLTSTFYDSFTDMMIPMGGWFAILFIPFLTYIPTHSFDFLDSFLFLWPTYSMIHLINGVMGTLDFKNILLSILYIGILDFILFKRSIKLFNKRVIGRKGDKNA